MKKLLLIALLMLLTSCGMFDSFSLEKAIDVVNNSDLPSDTKQVIIDAMRSAYGGGGVRGVLGDVADGAVALVLGYFGIKHAPKLFGKKPPAPPAG